MTNKEAVYAVLDEKGTGTSLAELAQLATARLVAFDSCNEGYQINKAYACILRRQYCAEHGIEQDMRLHGEKGSPHRSMYKDTTATLEQVQRLVNYLKVKDNTFTSLLELVGNDFHSIEQLRNTLNVLKNLQVQLT